MKSINDILFNNQLLDADPFAQAASEEDETGDGNNDEHGAKKKFPKKNWNIHLLTGKLLTAVFKDYLIYDDIFEFVQCYWNTADSQKYIVKYAKY